MDLNDIDEDAWAERSEAIFEALDVIFGRVNNSIDHVERQQVICHRAARACLGMVYDLVDMVYPVHQRSVVTATSVAHGSWEDDPEPVPCHVERWNRGFLTVAEPSNSVEPEKAAAPVEAKAMTRARSSLGLPQDVVPRARSPKRCQTRKISHAAAEVSEYELKLQERLREEIALRKVQNAALEMMKAKDALERANLEALCREMRGKEYAYDHTGSVVLLTRIDPARLPKPMVLPGFQQAAPGDEDDGKSRRKSEHGQHGAVGAAKRRAGRKATTDFLERPSETQPSPLEHIRLSPGVTLKAGNAVRAGPELSLDPAHMTRAQFAAFAAKKQRELDEVESKRRGGGAAESGRASFAATAPPAGGGLRNGSGSGAVQEARQSNGASVPTASATDKHTRDDRRPAEGMPAVPSPLPELSGVAPSLRQGRASLEELPPWIAAGRPKDVPRLRPRPSTPDAAAALASAGNWGSVQSGAYDPPPGATSFRKPTSLQVKETVGRNDRLPRLRAQQATTSFPVAGAGRTPAAKTLPAPLPKRVKSRLSQ